MGYIVPECTAIEYIQGEMLSQYDVDTLLMSDIEDYHVVEITDKIRKDAEQCISLNNKHIIIVYNADLWDILISNDNIYYWTAGLLDRHAIIDEQTMTYLKLSHENTHY